MFKEIVKVGEWAQLAYQKKPSLNGWVRSRRRRALSRHYRHLHYGVAHTMRSLTAEFIKGPEQNLDLIGKQAVDLVTEFRIGMGNLLYLSKSSLRCCLKMYQKNASKADGLELSTWATSLSDIHRPKRKNEPTSAKTSTVYAALTGEYDGRTGWRRFSCFCCNDLKQHSDKFMCLRTDYLKYYRSVLVFPVRFIRAGKDGGVDDIGFLAFDSPKVNAFADVPNIFDYCEKPDEYSNLCDDAATFHLGAVYADMWGTVMHGLLPQTSLGGGQYHVT